MALLIECIVGVILFTLIVIPMTIKDKLGSIGDYPPAIRQRCIELGLIEDRKRTFSTKEIIKKTLAVIVLAVVLSYVLKKFNNINSFMDGFINAYVIWLAIAWWDALVCDIGWFCHSEKSRIPGTEDMKEYKDYWFHIGQSFIGSLIGIPACALVGLITTLMR